MSERFANRYRIAPNRWYYWNYSAPGKYFITICSYDREPKFGTILDTRVVLSRTGKIIKEELLNIPNYNPHVELDQWIVMPNHLHLIIRLKEWNPGDTVDQIHEFDLHNYLEMVIHCLKTPLAILVNDIKHLCW